MELLMMPERLFPLLCQGNQNHPPVFFTAHSGNVSFFYQTIHGYGKRPHCHFLDLRYGGHALCSMLSYRCNDMHVIVGNIFKFLCNNRFFFNIHNVIKQLYQDSIQCFICFHSFFFSP